MSLSGNKTLSNREVGAMHVMCAHTRGPFWTHERGFAAYGQFVAAALPRVLDTRTVISYWWDTGGDGHRRIMAKHGVGVELPF